MLIEIFEKERQHLFGVAYRMVGRASIAEELVQETYLRCAHVEDVRAPRAYLTKVVTRLSLDFLKSAQHQREVYPGPWLPEPLVDNDFSEVAPDHTLSMAFMVLLEELNPIERAAFILRETLGFDYDHLADVLGKTGLNCRQIVSRAKGRLGSRVRRYEAAPEDSHQLVSAFLQATERGETEDLLKLLTTDAVMWSDGGGRAVAALRPIFGAEKITRFLLGIRRKAPIGSSTELCRVNGETGWLTLLKGRPISVWSLQCSDGQIEEIRVMRNDQKMRHL